MDEMNPHQSETPDVRVSAPSLGTRIMAGLAGGLCYAVVLSLIAIAIAAMRGTSGGELNLPGLLGAYIVGGLLGGVTMGVLWPTVTTRLRASIVTAISGFPLAKILGDLVNNPPIASGWRYWFAVVGTAIAMGAIGGRHLWEHKNETV